MPRKTGDPQPAPPSSRLPAGRCSFVADHTEVNFAPLGAGEPGWETTRRTGRIYLRERAAERNLEDPWPWSSGRHSACLPACRPGPSQASPPPPHPMSPDPPSPPSLPGTHPENAPTCSAAAAAMGELFYGFRTPTICPPSIQSTSPRHIPRPAQAGPPLICMLIILPHGQKS